AEERNKAELEYAAEIQRSALPSTFPAFPERSDFDIHAIMKPAREVGGDFYDFYFVDGNKLAISVSDVSGKGVPASLFMMRGKTLIKSYAQRGIMVNDIFTNVNYNLCEGNEAGLFITSWMGIVDLETGHVDFTNAGHNPPLIKKGNGEFEYLRTKPDFILGGMEGIAYKRYEMDLEEGSEIFLYTDGLTEAQNTDKELYGEDRLLESANTAEYHDSKEFCEHIKKQIDEFVGEADQFDDITMLHLRFIRKA
ncbi:MAG: serine/threonine-protein phosphatase, partial [Erysipelotrichaceae bacterium]|nr:serine/threonine-protein phosphatase [Erysipelotrichaceae bacterium]